MSFSVDGSRPVSEAHNVKELSEFSDASDRPSDTDLEKGEVNYPEQRDKSIRCRFLFPTRCRVSVNATHLEKNFKTLYLRRLLDCFSWQQPIAGEGVLRDGLRYVPLSVA